MRAVEYTAYSLAKGQRCATPCMILLDLFARQALSMIAQLFFHPVVARSCCTPGPSIGVRRAVACPDRGGRSVGSLFRLGARARARKLAELVGIGRGVDLILYLWVCISLIVLLNLHLKLRDVRQS